MSESGAPGEVETAIVGFEITGDPLLEGEFLPLRQGLTVFYGLNGAGKTRLLRGIRAAVTGVADDVAIGMVVRAERPPADDKRRQRRATAPSVLVALAEAIVASSARYGIAHQSAQAFGPGPLSSPDASVIVDDYIERHAGSEDPDLTTEISDSRLFLLMPTGSVANPSWDAWGVADLELPAATRVRGVLQQLYDEWQAADDGDEFEAFSEWQSRAAPHAIYWPAENNFFPATRRSLVTPANFSPYDRGFTDGEILSALQLRGEIDFGLDVLGLDTDSTEATERYLAEVVATLGRAVDFEGSDGGVPDPLASLLAKGPVTDLHGAIVELGGFATVDERWSVTPVGGRRSILRRRR